GGSGLSGPGRADAGRFYKWNGYAAELSGKLSSAGPAPFDCYDFSGVCGRIYIGNGFAYFVLAVWENTVRKSEDPGVFSLLRRDLCSDKSVFDAAYDWLFWNGRTFCGRASLCNRND